MNRYPKQMSPDVASVPRFSGTIGFHSELIFIGSFRRSALNIALYFLGGEYPVSYISLGRTCASQNYYELH